MQNSLSKFFLGITLFLSASFSSCSKVGTMDLADWKGEDSSGKVFISLINDTIDIVSPDGLTYWYDQKLTGNYEITYDATVVTEGGRYDRLSDLNCFWGASDPLYPNDLFARSEWRNGEFKKYNSMNLYYVGYGGNDNQTTRFRKYHAKYYNVDDAKIKPIIKEYNDPQHLLEPGKWYTVSIVVKDNKTTYSMNGKELFSQPIEKGECDGYYALRLWNTHVRFTHFKVVKL